MIYLLNLVLKHATKSYTRPLAIIKKTKMKKINPILIGILTVVFLITSCSKKLIYNSVKNQSLCADKDGYWYNNKCWKDYEDDGIVKTKIDSIVTADMGIIRNSTFQINNQTFPLVAFLPIEKDKEVAFIAVYGTKDNYSTLIFPTGKKMENLKNEVFESTALHFTGDAISGEMDKESKLIGSATINIIDIENIDVEISGNIVINENGNSQKFVFRTNEAVLGAGNSHIKIKENEAYLSGDLGTITYWQIKDLIENHPDVKTIVMTNISGSVNDAVNMHTGRLVHENGFTTKLLSDSDIASGGVDLFCAGVNRIVEKGAKIGVHSWCCINDLTAIEIPKDHPAHKYQLEYFTMALGSEKGPDFYFYTLEAAPFDSIHYMTDEEIEKWNIATDFIENK